MGVISERNNEISSASYNTIVLSDSPSQTNLNIVVEDNQGGMATAFTSMLSTSENSIKILHTNHDFKEYSSPECSSALEYIEPQNYDLNVNLLNILTNYERLRGQFCPVLTLNPQTQKHEIESKSYLSTAKHSTILKNGENLSAAASIKSILPIGIEDVQEKISRSIGQRITLSIFKKFYADKADFFEKLLNNENKLTEENKNIIISFLNDDFEPYDKKLRKIRRKKCFRLLKKMWLSKCCRKS